MGLNAGLLESQTQWFEFENYVRIIPILHVATPLGCAPGVSRFGGTDQSFAVLYAAFDLPTALAEAVVRDRFEGIVNRRLFAEEITDVAAVHLKVNSPLRLVDLRKGGCLKLGISTDIAGAKKWGEAQEFSQTVYQYPTIDGILYASRLTSENCVAIFDRVTATHLEADHIAPLTQLEDLEATLGSLGIELVR